jgi:hypothetical protein
MNVVAAKHCVIRAFGAVLVVSMAEIIELSSPDYKPHADL